MTSGRTDRGQADRQTDSVTGTGCRRYRRHLEWPDWNTINGINSLNEKLFIEKTEKYEYTGKLHNAWNHQTSREEWSFSLPKDQQIDFNIKIAAAMREAYTCFLSNFCHSFKILAWATYIWESVGDVLAKMGGCKYTPVCKPGVPHACVKIASWSKAW